MAKEKTDWLKIWFDDKEAMIDTMRRNLAADLEAGYDVNGYSVRKQIVDIETYEREFKAQAERVGEMEIPRAQYWCYCDLRKRGAIA